MHRWEFASISKLFSYPAQGRTFGPNGSAVFTSTGDVLTGGDFEDLMIRMSADGWELVTGWGLNDRNQYLYFKRLIE